MGWEHNLKAAGERSRKARAAATEKLVAEAYARYDSDPRSHSLGHGDMDAFRDALRPLISELGGILPDREAD